MKLDTAAQELHRKLGRSPSPKELGDRARALRGGGARGDGGRLRLRRGLARAAALRRRAATSRPLQDTLGTEEERYELVEYGATIAPTLQGALPARAPDLAPALRRGPDPVRDRRAHRRLPDARLAVDPALAGASPGGGDRVRRAEPLRVRRRRRRPSRRSRARSPRAAAARGSSSGARASPPIPPAATGASATGHGRCRASATLGRGSWWSVSRRRRTAATAPGGSSPATARATGSSARCTERASPTSRRSERPRRRAAARAAPTSRRSCAALRRRIAHDERARHVPALSRARARAPGRGAACWWRSAASPGTARLLGAARQRCRDPAPQAALRPRRGGRGRSVHACSAAFTRASRTRSRAS